MEGGGGGGGGGGGTLRRPYAFSFAGSLFFEEEWSYVTPKLRLFSGCHVLSLAKQDGFQRSKSLRCGD